MAQKSPDFVVSEESKNILMDKIQDLEFVEGQCKLKLYSCCHCKKVAIKHRIANCRDVFCRDCFYEQYYQEPCPVCQTVITQSTQDDEFKKAVFQLKVSCEFKKNGCQSVVDLGDFLGHVADCKFATKSILPEVYETPLQTETLEQLNASFQDMKNMMRELMTEKQQLKDAFKKQEEDIVEMKKAFDGLVIEIPRVHQELQNKLNACMADTKQLTTLTKELKLRLDRIEMADQCPSNRETLPRDLDVSTDSQDTTFHWTISEIEKKLKKCKCGDVLAESEEFSIPSHGLKFRARLKKLRGFPEQRTLISLKFIGELPADSPPFYHSRKYVLVDQSDGEEKRDAVMLDQPLFGQNSTKDMTHNTFWYSTLNLIRLFRYSDKYVKDDTLLIRIILEPITAMYKSITLTDGTLLLRIDNYSKRKQEAIEGIRQQLVSESFYTSAKGYRMEMEINLNGIYPNEGKGITIYPTCQIGEWDDDLPSFPIKCKYERVLMDQSGRQPNRNIVYKPKGCEYSQCFSFCELSDFMCHKEIEKFPYLKEDSLLIKFVVTLTS